jgi:hypothetical protein
MTETLVRTRTRPEIKWLANELAATAGELQRVEQELAWLVARRERLVGVHAALTHVAGQLGAAGLERLVPTVKAHDERYGGRGGLRKWLRETLQMAYPRAVDSKALLELAMPVFGLEFSSKEARRKYYDNTFRRQLLALAEQGFVERMAVQGLVRTGWRWKVEAPTMGELRAKEGTARGGPAAAVRSREAD